MDQNSLWPKVKAALRRLPPSGHHPDEYLLDTKFRPKHSNRIRIFDDHLERLSDQGNSEWQTIRNDDILWYGAKSIEAGDKGFCIKNQPGEPPRMGSIICAMLDLLDEFAYMEGQILHHLELKG